MELKEFWWHCQSESTKLGLWDPVAYAWELDACTAARPAIVSNQHGSFQTFVQVWSLCVRPKVKFANAAIQISYFNAKLNRHEVGSRCLEIWGHKAWNGGANWPKRQCLRFFLNSWKYWKNEGHARRFFNPHSSFRPCSRWSCTSVGTVKDSPGHCLPLWCKAECKTQRL